MGLQLLFLSLPVVSEVSTIDLEHQAGVVVCELRRDVVEVDSEFFVWDPKFFAVRDKLLKI